MTHDVKLFSYTETQVSLCLPLQLSDPEVVLLAVLEDGQQRDIFALLQRVWVGGDRPHLSDLKPKEQQQC